MSNWSFLGQVILRFIRGITFIKFIYFQYIHIHTQPIVDVIQQSLSNNFIGLFCMIWIFSISIEDQLVRISIPYFVLKYTKAWHNCLDNFMLILHLIWMTIPMNFILRYFQTYSTYLFQCSILVWALSLFMLVSILLYKLSMGCHTVSPVPVWVRIWDP